MIMLPVGLHGKTSNGELISPPGLKYIKKPRIGLQLLIYY
jgi:hypothetical protein